MLRRIGLVGAIVFVAGCGSTTLGREGLQKEVESIGSAAAEGALLAHDAADGRTTTAFVEVHSEALAEQLSKVEEKLGSAETSTALRAQREQAEQLARRVSEHLEGLHDAAGDEAAAAAFAARLDADTKLAEELAK